MTNVDSGSDTAILILPVSMSILAYGIVKERLFDIDLIIKRSIQYAIVTVCLAGVFFLIEKLVEGLVKSRIAGDSKISGLVATGVVLISSIPIKSMGEKLTDKWFPELVKKKLYKKHKKRYLKIYKKQLETAYADGKAGKNERRMLRELQRSFGITDKERGKLERKIRKRRDRR